jgi:hypothetical protein
MPERAGVVAVDGLGNAVDPTDEGQNATKLSSLPPCVQWFTTVHRLPPLGYLHYFDRQHSELAVTRWI